MVAKFRKLKEIVYNFHGPDRISPKTLFLPILSGLFFDFVSADFMRKNTKLSTIFELAVTI